MDTVIRIRELRVQRGETLVLPGVSLTVRRGIVTGLLGPSGKTIFDSREDRFLVVEPKISREDIEEWSSPA